VLGHHEGSPAGRLPSILIVDGDDDTRELYRTILEPVAGSILEADDGVAALDAVTQLHPDLIITETRLRGLDGYALCERLRADPQTAHSLRLVVTASARVSDLTHAAECGADRLLVKPCTPEALRAIVLDMWSQRAVEAKGTH
jgi:CheY-like chemotaxis protein